MGDNTLKDLFVQKRYNEVIELLQDIFRKLFVQMLDYKKDEIEEDYKDMDYNRMALVIAKYYPQYDMDIINLTHAEYREDNTYLDVINLMLSIYSYMQDTYTDDYEEIEYEPDYD